MRESNPSLAADEKTRKPTIYLGSLLCPGRQSNYPVAIWPSSSSSSTPIPDVYIDRGALADVWEKCHEVSISSTTVYTLG